MERIRAILRKMKDIPKEICISPTDDVKKDYITTPPIFFNASAIPISKSLTFKGAPLGCGTDVWRMSEEVWLITDNYLSELGLDKQTYTAWELNKKLQLISKHPECIVEKYDTMNWTESTFDTITHIADYISADYNNEHDDYYSYFYFIYNNIIVFIISDSEISKTSTSKSIIRYSPCGAYRTVGLYSLPTIQFKYVKSQIDICDLDKIKKIFKFLSAF